MLNNSCLVDPEVGKVLHKFSLLALKSTLGYCKSSLTGLTGSHSQYLLAVGHISSIVLLNTHQCGSPWWNLWPPVGRSCRVQKGPGYLPVTSSLKPLSCLCALLGCPFCLEPREALIPRR